MNKSSLAKTHRHSKGLGQAISTCNSKAFYHVLRQLLPFAITDPVIVVTWLTDKSEEARASLVAQMVKDLPVMWKTRFDLWVRKILWKGNGNPLQHSGLENLMDRGAWWATVHRVARSQTWLKWLGRQAGIYYIILLYFIILLKCYNLQNALLYISLESQGRWQGRHDPLFLNSRVSLR